MYSPFFETGKDHDAFIEATAPDQKLHGGSARYTKPKEMTDADRKQMSIDHKMQRECDCTADELFAGAHYSNCKWVLGMTPEELATTSKQII